MENVPGQMHRLINTKTIPSSLKQGPKAKLPYAKPEPTSPVEMQSFHSVDWSSSKRRKINLMSNSFSCINLQKLCVLMITELLWLVGLKIQWRCFLQMLRMMWVTLELNMRKQIRQYYSMLMTYSVRDMPGWSLNADTLMFCSPFLHLQIN